MPHHALLRTAATALALAALAACSSTPKPTEEMAVGRATLDRVTAMPEVAQNAPVELQRARDKWMQAQRAMDNKDYKEARRLATEAEADARLAESKAEAVDSARTRRQVQDSIRSLQQEIDYRDRTAGTPVPPAVPPVAPAPAPLR
ncbi:DUF4398 domain-containing protein [Melaminivora alkalimesophila]|uniref:Uncharacterized protein DUF4398 n=1 Tax=Melaminivora alkalimesophila TaxID=1165852 RepID=A0A317RGV6_9BURK|nr:DUF4398 domain-containing protein [Melaminivora alkalimesophila]PWW47000.1 uncharacterized protein DUF4398 [Melaminivora alkalimesophila]